MTKQPKKNKQKTCNLDSQIQTELKKMVLLLEIFELVTEELIDLTMVQCNLYLQKKRRYSLCLQKKLTDLQGINYIMTIIKLLTYAEYWQLENLVKNTGIFFADHTCNNKVDRAYCIVRPVIDC